MAALVHVGVNAARVGSVWRTCGAEGAQALEVVEIAAVFRFILDAGNAGAGERVGRKGAIGEVGTDLRVNIAACGTAEFWSCRYFLLAGCVFGLWTSADLV